MNERIQQLHEEAMKSCDEYRSDTLNYHRIYREKFAELIIRDCLKEIKDMIVDESERLYPNNKQTTECVNDRLMDAYDNITEHFGVE